MPVSELLILLGEKIPSHSLDDLRQEWVQAGEQILFKGKTTHPETGQASLRISDYFYCIDCHSVSPESSDLASADRPQERLDHLQKINLPLVPGSTFAGIVNRESWYNGDYAEKYALPSSGTTAQNDLRKAIDLCSRECSQGRAPEEWEIEAILTYLWSLQWNIADLGFTGADLAELKRRALNAAEHPAIAADIRRRYTTAAPATFGTIPKDLEAGYPTTEEAQADNGRVVFERACLHCHGAEGASEHFFGDKPATWKKLAQRFSSTSQKSLYELIRHGTKPDQGKRPYMPNFTEERLSNNQIEDLRAYLEQMATHELPEDNDPDQTEDSPPIQPSESTGPEEKAEETTPKDEA